MLHKKCNLHNRNRDPSGRPTFSSIVDSLARPDSIILMWNEKEKGDMLGGPLNEGNALFPDLQDYYHNIYY